MPSCRHIYLSISDLHPNCRRLGVLVICTPRSPQTLFEDCVEKEGAVVPSLRVRGKQFLVTKKPIKLHINRIKPRIICKFFFIKIIHGLCRQKNKIIER